MCNRLTHDKMIGLYITIVFQNELFSLIPLYSLKGTLFPQNWCYFLHSGLYFRHVTYVAFKSEFHVRNNIPVFNMPAHNESSQIAHPLSYRVQAGHESYLSMIYRFSNSVTSSPTFKLAENKNEYVYTCTRNNGVQKGLNRMWWFVLHCKYHH